MDDKEFEGDFFYCIILSVEINVFILCVIRLKIKGINWQIKIFLFGPRLSYYNLAYQTFRFTPESP